MLRLCGNSVLASIIPRFIVGISNTEKYFIIYGKNVINAERYLNPWRIDETYIKVKGKDRYLYRAIDSNGNTMDMWLRNHRNTVSTKSFVARLIQDYGQPSSIVTDKYAPSLKAINELKEDGVLDQKVNHWKSKYLNNILEQDHRQVKGKFPYGNSFQSTYTAATTIKGIEVISALYKESRREITLFDFSPWDEIENLFKVA